VSYDQTEMRRESADRRRRGHYRKLVRVQASHRALTKRLAKTLEENRSLRERVAAATQATDSTHAYQRTHILGLEAELRAVRQELEALLHERAARKAGR
jgi:hypothetical protein